MRACVACAEADGVVVRDGEGDRGLSIALAADFALMTSHGDVVTTRLLAACDGAGSATRKLLGIREAARKGHLYVLETEPTSLDDGLGERLCDF